MKRAYLTIDDGPSVDRKEKVDILNKYGIQAVWFSLGADMLDRPEEAIYTINNGQILGNHSFTHPNFSEITLEQCKEEIFKTDEVIDEFYRQAGIERPIRLFRFPYGNEGVNRRFYDFDYTNEEHKRISEIQKILISKGYVTYSFDDITYKYFEKMKKIRNVDWLWTYDAMEWCVFQENQPYGVKCLDDVIEMMDIDLPERWMGLNYQDSNEIVVIHDHPQTTGMFEPIIKQLLNKGIEFKKIV